MSGSTRIRAVLFDLDGTLVDSAPGLGAAVDRMRIDRGMPSLPMQRYRPLAGSGARGMLGEAFGIQPDHPDFAVMRDEFFSNYESAMAAGTTAFDGVLELLQELERRALRWGIVTNKAERFALPLIRSMPLFASACAIVAGDTTPHAKPHPEPLLEAARRLGVAPSACVYVGDDERDIVAGRAAGMRTMAAAYGYLGAQGDVTAWNADAVANSPRAILQWLEAG